MMRVRIWVEGRFCVALPGSFTRFLYGRAQQVRALPSPATGPREMGRRRACRPQAPERGGSAPRNVVPAGSAG